MEQQKVTKIHIYHHIDLDLAACKQGDNETRRFSAVTNVYPTFIDAVTADTTVGEIPKSRRSRLSSVTISVYS